MRHVALEVPLRLLALGGRAERHDAADARIERLGDALDGSALARGVAAFKENHYAQTFVADPFLQLDQLDLQAAKLALVFAIFPQAQRIRAKNAVTGITAIAVRVIVVPFRLFRHGRTPDFAHGAPSSLAGHTVIPSIGSGRCNFSPRAKARHRLANLQHFFAIRVQGEKRSHRRRGISFESPRFHP